LLQHIAPVNSPYIVDAVVLGGSADF